MTSLRGKVAIVTGASSGIGQAIAERLARDGATVVVNYSKSATGSATVVERIHAQGGFAVAVQADIAVLSDIRRLFSETQRLFKRLDILIANAGVSIFKPLSEVTEEDFDSMFSVNAKGTFFCLQHALNHLSDGGKIIAISTIGTVLNVPGGACYFGSKGAVEQFCRTLAKEVVGRGITVNVVSPGITETPMLTDTMEPAALAAMIEMTPLQRLGQADEIADVVSFLCSENGRWVNRQNIAVDGGIISR
jgi:3-oxoacyl-[acyl-carrier protein] reductase